MISSFHCQLGKKRIIRIRWGSDQTRIRIRSILFQVDNEKSWTPLYLRIEHQGINLFEGSMNPLDPSWKSKWLYTFDVDNTCGLSTGSNGVSLIWWITLKSALNIHQNGLKPFDQFVRIQSGLFPDPYIIIYGLGSRLTDRALMEPKISLSWCLGPQFVGFLKSILGILLICPTL